MSKPFKFRYVNEIVGLFVLLAAAAFVTAVVATARLQGWFEPQVLIYTTFPDEGAFGLKPGDEVMIMGTLAGSLRQVITTETGDLEGEMSIKGRFEQYVRTDSVAMVKRTFGIGGDVYIEISRGKSAPLPSVHPFLEIEEDTELFEKIKNTVDELQAELIQTVDLLNEALVQYAGLAADLRDPEGPLQAFLVRLNSLGARIEEGDGLAGKILSDPEMADAFEEAMGEVNGSLEDVRVILADLQRASSQLPEITRSAGNSVDEVPAVIAQTGATLEEIEKLVEGLQRHWLVRKYIERSPELTDPLPPSLLSGGLPVPGEEAP